MPVKYGFNETNIALMSVETLNIFLTEMGYLHAQKNILLD